MKTCNSPECRRFSTVATRYLSPQRVHHRLRHSETDSIIDRSPKSASGAVTRAALIRPPTVLPAANPERRWTMHFKDTRTHGRIQWLTSTTPRRLLFSSRLGLVGGRWSSNPTLHLHLRATHGGCVALYSIAEPRCVEPLYGDGGTTRSAVCHGRQNLSHKSIHSRRGLIA